MFKRFERSPRHTIIIEKYSIYHFLKKSITKLVALNVATPSPFPWLSAFPIVAGQLCPTLSPAYTCVTRPWFPPVPNSYTFA